ncbi:MAG: hypothetical protein KC736_02625 [Candidatus Moranbacteria bacterium]|nr:hypothetical protein [Candidatus Moranbacteria bacterium]
MEHFLYHKVPKDMTGEKIQRPYTAFSQKDSGINGGFERTNEEITNGTLVVVYH